MAMLQRLARFASIGISLAILPCCVSAQRGGAAPVAVAAVPRAVAMPVAAAAMHAAPVHVVAPHPAMHTGAPAGPHPVAPYRPVKPASPRPPARNYPASSHPGYPNAPITSYDSFDDGGYPVPGLGFDYPHYAAVHPNAFRHHFRGGAIVPFIGGGGIYVPLEYYGEPAPQPEQPAEAAAEPEQAQAERPDYAAGASAPMRQRYVAASSPAPEPEYIFVRRDGTVFFAVAYSWTNGSLQYITQEGLRKIIPLATLDLDATSQFNEQRGVSFRSPA